ncbi:hypothetical protein [Cryobacterium sp. TMT4-31]|uniref:hypothetical protein n=1 Tax=Cryobacterium sp. TMT4-31 TaxID=1259259 RepID=UPI00106CFB6F|nr:hypothetical protein [Cryobacterium sp. TMT4-31]TFC87772.1 hypothetical protein E3T19_11615 [Cryobacterium sp. TMT4-31]
MNPFGADRPLGSSECWQQLLKDENEQARFLLPASCFLLPASCFLLPASCFVAAGLAALVLSGCATPPVSEPNDAAGASAVLGVGTEQVLPHTPPADASIPGDDEVWEANYAPLGTATAAIEEQFPDEFGYAFFDKTPAMHVAFKRSAPAEAVVLLQNNRLALRHRRVCGFQRR